MSLYNPIQSKLELEKGFTKARGAANLPESSPGDLSLGNKTRDDQIKAAALGKVLGR